MKKMFILSTVALLATPAFSQTLSIEGCRSDLFCPVIGEQSGTVLYLTRRTGSVEDRHVGQHEAFYTGSIPEPAADDGSSSDGDDGEGTGEEGHAGGHGTGNGKGHGNGCGGGKGGGHESGQGEGGGGGGEADQAPEPEAGKTCGPKGQDAKVDVIEGPEAVGG